jgi:hypothetical protein
MVLNQQRNNKRLFSISNELEEDFSLWAIKNLPLDVPGEFRKQLAGIIYSESAFRCYFAGNLSEAGWMSIQCFINDPVRWLGNKGLVSILLESLIGTKKMKRIRNIKRKFSSK